MENDNRTINVVRVKGISVPFAVGVFVSVIALVIICEWAFGIKIIAHLSPTDSSMKINSAIIFLLFALSLTLHQSRKLFVRVVVKILTLFGMTIAALSLAQYIFGVDLGIDELVFKDNPNPDITSSPGRMSPLVAANFLLTGMALLLWKLTGKNNHRPSEYFALAALFIPVMALIGYIFSAASLYSFTTVTGVAFITANLFLILLSGILAVYIERGFATILLSRTRGGLVLRFLLPSSLFTLVLLYWISVHSARIRLISENLVVPLGLLASGAVISFLIWRSAKLLYDADIKEKQTFAELQAAHKTAEEANRAKDEFISVVSHELRTPLNSILGWARIVNADASEENVRRALEVITRQSENQLQLIEDLLDTSRVISGKMRLDIKPFRIEEVVREAIETVRPAAEAKKINLIFDKPDALSWLSGDPDRLQQVFWNLLANAVKFTPRGGAICVRLSETDAHSQIEVTDTGDGIAAEFLPHVFERFRQSDNSVTRRSGGLGLGLSLARNIIELHGGEISAKSEGRGKGSTFTVRLPIKETT